MAAHIAFSLIDDLRCLGGSAELYTVFLKCFCHDRKHFFCHISVDEKCLRCIAGGGVLCLGVYDDRDCLFNIRILVYVCVADSVCVSHDRDLGVVHYILHKCI